MNVLVPILWSVALSGARAESVLEFKTNTPVAVLIDGQQASVTSNMHQRMGGLAPGVHELTINGVFGKTLYQAEIDLPDNTITTAEWAKGEIKVLSTDWLEEEATDEDAAEAPVEDLPSIEVPTPPVPVAEDVPEVPAAPVARPPIAVPAERPARAASALPTAAAPKPHTLTVQATDGMKIDVVYEGRTMSILVDGDQIRIQDASGAVLALDAE